MKKEFYQSELEKFKLADGTNASDKFDEKFVEFMEGTEPTDTILEYGGPHPAALDNHPSRHQVADEYIDRHDFEDWQDNFVYGAKELPNIALLMMGQWKRTEPFFNTLEVGCGN
jgi:hypothetical protein